jgi:neuronal cell adhesion protein
VTAVVIEKFYLNFKTQSSFFFSYYIEATTGAVGILGPKPDIPSFEHVALPSENGYSKVKINWRPNLAGNPGSHFYVKYREEGESNYEKSEARINEDFAEVGGLDSDKVYEFRVVSVDGDEETESASKLIEGSSGKLR